MFLRPCPVLLLEMVTRSMDTGTFMAGYVYQIHLISGPYTGTFMAGYVNHIRPSSLAGYQNLYGWKCLPYPP